MKRISFSRQLRNDVREVVRERVVLPLEQEAVGRVVSVAVLAALALLLLVGFMSRQARA